MASRSMRTHVGRDILQNAQLFRTTEAAVWEYVVNSLQYVDDGVTPRVDIAVDPAAGTVVIADNGRGMSHEDINDHFLVMHAENLDRLRGRAGRGRNGTGKSAAFGVGDELIVDTVRNGRRNCFRITRSMIEETASGSTVPVEDIAIDEPSKRSNGTLVTIGGIPKRQLNMPALLTWLERYLSKSRWMGVTVTVNGIEIAIRMPSASRVHRFAPSPEQSALIGDVELEVSVSVSPLDTDDQGVFITAGPGNLLARESAGVTSKEFGNRLFGFVDCPALESPDGAVEAITSARDLRLNYRHRAAAALMSFIGVSLESVRAELVEEFRSRRAAADAERKAALANEISSLLNNDFADVAARLDAAGADLRKRSRVAAPSAPTDEAALPEWATSDVDLATALGSELGLLAQNHGDPVPSPEAGDNRKPDGNGHVGGENASLGGEIQEDGVVPLRKVARGDGRRPRGGLRVTYERSGEEEHRSFFDVEASTIIINEDHPAIAAAMRADAASDDGSEVNFRRLSLEVAASEYSLAVARFAATRFPEMGASDVLYEVREALNRISRVGAAMY